MNCKICNTESLFLFKREIDRPDFSSYEHEYYECQKCSFMFSTGLDNLTKEQWDQFYKYPDYLQFDGPARDEFKAQNMESTRIKFLERLMLKLPNVRSTPIKKVLIWGNGKSLLLKKLNLKYDTYATYSSTNSSKELTEKDFPKFKNSFDLVTSIEVIEHFTDPLEEFKVMKSLLKPGGQILASTGSKDSHIWSSSETCNIAESLNYLIPYRPRNGGHICFYAMKTVEKLAEILGMKNDSTDQLKKICILLTK